VLVGAAVAGGLVQELLERLEWRTRDAAATHERDEAVERVLAIDVLRLLAADGAQAAEVCTNLKHWIYLKLYLDLDLILSERSWVACNRF